MTPALRSVPGLSRHNPTLAIVVALGLFPTWVGCARLRPFQAPGHEHPQFGTEPSLVEPAGISAAPTNDPYAEEVRRTRSERGDLPDTHHLARVVPAREPLDRPHSRPQAPTESAGPRTPAAPPIPDTLDESSNILQVPEARSVAEPPPTRAATVPAAVSPPATVPKGPTLVGLIAESRRRIDSLTTYRVAMHYQERVAGKLQPVDSALLSIKSSPKRVRIEWPDGPNKGREVLYASDLHGGMMHVRMGGVMSALPRISMKPDSPLATRSSRHPIVEAGFDTIVTRMEEGVREAESGSVTGTRIRYAGLEQAEGLNVPCHKIERITPVGETWLVYLHPETMLPTMVQATAPNGELLEHYLFLDPELEPVTLAEHGAFDPDVRWGPSSGGFLQRLARSAAEQPTPPETR